jgi:hypothetical protein
MTDETIRISCPDCGLIMRVPAVQGTFKRKCPICNCSFSWSNEPQNQQEEPYKNVGPTTIKYSTPPKTIAVGVGIIIVVLVACFFIRFSSVQQSKPSAEESKPSASLNQPLRWIVVSYGDLLDNNQIVRTGEPLRVALLDPHLRGAIQQFVDKYSCLLQDSLELINGPDATPHRNVIDHFPLGTTQPAWVAIFRGGRIFVSADNKNHARIFLIGDNPRDAYTKNYSIIRHCLSGLLPADGSNLKMDVYSYRNNYEKSELQLCLMPYTFEASSFPLPDRIVPLDLEGLEQFFEKDGELEGAELDNDKGLFLYAKKGSQQLIDGHKLSLSDFAVAYRAAFHAGDNEAFISLDPHQDPTRVTVNFGGFLEDTRIGVVVLESDKRFKTITSGLDPNSFKDMRSHTRSFVKDFMTSNEREFLQENANEKKGKWVGTRLWFYPESIEIESDLSYKYARIAKPRFTADAERSKDDFSSPQEFNTKKKTTLSPSILENIEHLNQHYDQYENAFPEIRELTVVARLMGIASWLRRTKHDWLDLDALLSVEIPPVTTMRDKQQLITAALLSYSKNGDVTENYVKNNSSIVYLSPILQKTVKQFFVNKANAAKYLCDEDRTGLKPFKGASREPIDIRRLVEYPNACQAEAETIMSAHGNSKVRDIVKSKEDMKAIASYAGSTIESPKALSLKNIREKLESDKRNLADIKRNIESIKSRTGSDRRSDNSYVSEHNALVDQYEHIRQRLNKNIATHNQLASGTQVRRFTRISGGINLEPKYFAIKTTSTSAKLQQLQSISGKIGLDWSSADGSLWIRNRAVKGGSVHNSPLITRMDWSLQSSTKSNSAAFTHLSTGKKQNYWLSKSDKDASWHDMVGFGGSFYRERLYNAVDGTLNVAEYQSRNLRNYFVAKKVGANTIVFSKSTRKDLIKPTEPPIWWISK